MTESTKGQGTTTIIGIDCATRPAKVGLALGLLHRRGARIQEVVRGSEVSSIAGTVRAWMGHSRLTLLALDAPLGWPEALASELSEHRAGEPLFADPKQLFARLTDRHIENRLGRRPLEVGANWIARTAHAALMLLSELRKASREAISLAWEPPHGPGTYAIEVYPAGTLAAYGLDASGYKEGKNEAHAERRVAILDFLEERLALPCGREGMQKNAHKLDAALCVLAGLDFLQGEAVAPAEEHRPMVRKEGWIWVKDRELA